MELPEAYQLADQVWMVPCQLIIDLETYNPLIKPYKAPVKAKDRLRNAWNIKEDQYLALLVEMFGPRNWSSIAKDLNRVVHQNEQFRNGKQCRERWMNQLDPKLTKNSWTQEEDFLIKRMQKEIGNKWSQISKILQGRTERQVKNRWKRIKKIRENNSRDNFQQELIENEQGGENLFQDFYKGSPLALDDLEGTDLPENVNDGLANDCKGNQDRLDDMSPIRVPSFISENDCNLSLANFLVVHDTDFLLENICLEKSKSPKTTNCINSYSLIDEKEPFLSALVL